MKHYPFKSDGTFRICQFTDLHLHTYDRFEEGEQTYALLRQTLRDTNPDLVVITGDIAWGKEPESAIAELEKIFAEAGVMWAPVLGNHDGEYFMESLQIPNEEGRRMFAQRLFTENSLYETGAEGVDGNGNYVVTVGGTEDAPAWALFLLDSHRGYFDLGQNLWYRETSKALPHSHELSFFHIPFPEYVEVWDYTACKGYCLESSCDTEMNDGMFAAMVECGKMRGVFVGHDHINDFEGTLKGIRLCYGRGSGYQTYGYENYARGARIIDIDASADFKTYIYLATGEMYEQDRCHRPKLMRKHQRADELLK